MSYIFVSYSKKNRDYAYKLVKKLKNRGFNVWIDNHELRPGQKWWESICKALAVADAFIVIMTPESQASKWVQKEVHLAEDWNIPALPILQSGERFDIYSDTQFADVRNPSRTKFPTQEYYDELAEILLPNGGEDVTNQPVFVPDHIQSDIQQAMDELPFENGDDGINIGGGGYTTLTSPDDHEIELPHPRKLIFVGIIAIILIISTAFTMITGANNFFCNQNSSYPIIVRLANGTDVYNSYTDEGTVNTIIFPTDINIPRELIALARDYDDEGSLWFFVHHPTQLDTYGWVHSLQVGYDVESHLCLSEYNTNTFPRDTHPIYDALPPR